MGDVTPDIGCFAEGCPATAPTGEHGTVLVEGWGTQADRSRYACPRHLDDLRRLLGLSVGPQPVDG